jgi:hypothetical protein
MKYRLENDICVAKHASAIALSHISHAIVEAALNLSLLQFFPRRNYLCFFVGSVDEAKRGGG